MTPRFIDAAAAPDGKIVGITADGTIMAQSGAIGTAWQHLPASQRPLTISVFLEAPPATPRRVFLGGPGQIFILCDDGRIYERQSDRTSMYIQKYTWQPVPLETPNP